MEKLLKITSLFTLMLFVLGLSVTACNKEEDCENPESGFQGNVIIVGAGAAGLAAAQKLEEKGISYQILEATDRLGGRIQKDESFADFPIDLGAEWIHEDKSILNYLTNQPGDEPNV